MNYWHNSVNKEDFKAIFETAIKHSMVLIMLADGVIEENEKKQVHKIINQSCRNKLTLDQLDDYITKVQTEKEDVSKYLKKIAGTLNEHGKELIIRCALSVAAADGNVDESELKMIAKMAQALEMSNSHFKGILTGLNDIIQEQQAQISQPELSEDDHSRFMPK